MRFRNEKLAQKQDTIDKYHKYQLHWDGVKLGQIGSDDRKKVERLVTLLSNGEETHLLVASSIANKEGETQADEIYRALYELDLLER